MVSVKISVTGLQETNRYLRRKINTKTDLCMKVNVGIGDRVHNMLNLLMPVWDGDFKSSITRTEVVFTNTARLWFRFPVRHAQWAENGRPSARARSIPNKPNHTMRYWTQPHQQGQIIFRKKVGPAPQQPNKNQHLNSIQRSTSFGQSVAKSEASKKIQEWLRV